VYIHVTAPAPGKVVVRGRVPEGRKPLVHVFEVQDAAAFARTLFIEALRRAGVVVDASPLTLNPADRLPASAAVGKLPRVALLTSPPFSESIRLVLKVSHNLHASTLPLLVAAKNGKRTLEEGMRLQRDFLARAGVDVDTISFGGGAGGSRADYTTARATVQLLRYMDRHKDCAAYRAALPILGVDGTLAAAVPPDSPARGKVKAKTGTLIWHNTMNDRFLLGSKAMAGYLTTAKGRTLAFAMFVNQAHLPRPSDAARDGKVLGKLCEIVHASR
jgi:D-alanyl-D-alanine carboxypeptidase/D-alanyl-D-alanine-endopeptidase (penicillin-binding protein 4)